MKPKKNYQFRNISGQLEIKVIHANLVLGNIEFLDVCPIVN
jgi:hypothetical protein